MRFRDICSNLNEKQNQGVAMSPGGKALLGKSWVVARPTQEIHAYKFIKFSPLTTRFSLF
jgi:hypothetical protein